MLGVLLTLLLISLPLISTQACVWEFHWSETLTDNENITPNRPTSLNCSLYFNDKMRFYNGDTMDHKIYRVNSSQAYLDCDNTSLFRNTNDETPPPVVVTAGAFTMFNINGQKLDLSALEQAYLISEKIDGYDGDCFKTAFSVGGDGARDCSATEDCIYRLQTTQQPTPSSSSSTTTIPTVNSPLNKIQTVLVIVCFFFICLICLVFMIPFVFVLWLCCFRNKRKSYKCKKTINEESRKQPSKQ